MSRGDDGRGVLPRTDQQGRLDPLVAAAAQLGSDELAVLTLVAERLVQGRQRYGALHVAADPRDFRREALEEAADGLVYVACGLMQGRTR